MGKKITKRDCQHWHVQKRSLERLNYKFSIEEIAEIVNAALNNQHSEKFKTEFIEKQSNRLYLYRLEFRDKKVNIIIDKIRKSLVTILFEEPNIKKITCYYDIFNNKVNTAEESINFWLLDKNTMELTIPFEDVIYKDEIFTLVQSKKQFKLIDEELVEI